MLADPTRRNARDDDVVARFECGDGVPDLVHDADALVTEDAAGRAGRNIAF